MLYPKWELHWENNVTSWRLVELQQQIVLLLVRYTRTFHQIILEFTKSMIPGIGLGMLIRISLKHLGLNHVKVHNEGWINQYLRINLELSPWLKSIDTQLWWCFGTSNGDLTQLQEKLNAIPDHLSNIHSFADNEKYVECAHRPLTDEQRGSKTWMDPNSVVS